MAGLQRSSMSFRRQGSSGFVWDDRFLSGELKQQVAQDHGEENEIIIVKDVKPPRPIKTVQRSRSNGGGRGYRGSGKITPAIEPPLPKVSAHVDFVEVSVKLLRTMLFGEHTLVSVTDQGTNDVKLQQA